jgi:type IV secretory pathway VirB10-like protein
MRSSRGLALGVVFVAAGAGCAGAPAERAPPVAAPAAATERQQPSADAPAPSALEAPAAASPPPPPPAPVTVAAPSAAQKDAREAGGRGAGWSEVDRARALLQASLGDCTTACRALGSMERATAHLCALSVPGDDARSCQDARELVLSGRDRVRASCGECPGGPSLDRGAPIPSTR